MAGPEDVAALAGCAEVAGLVIRTGMALDVGGLAGLAIVRGPLQVGPSVGLAQVALPGLREVTGRIRVVANGDLRELALPALERAGAVSIEGNGALAGVAIAELREVAGELVVAGNAELAVLEAPRLARVGQELAIADNAALVLAELPELRAVPAVRVERNPMLPPGTAEALRQLASRP
jgi:hypothetical protein